LIDNIFVEFCYLINNQSFMVLYYKNS